MKSSPRCGIIVAVSPEGVIGLHGTIPWKYPGDLRRFKRVTMGATVVMGRVTWESIGRPLPGRRNIVVSRTPVNTEGVITVPDVRSAIAASEGPVWFIGGARIYRDAMPHADCIDVTYVPDHVVDPEAVVFPEIDLSRFEPGPLVVHEDEPELRRRVYTLRRAASVLER